MKIGLIGYGKMGKAVEVVALEKGHTVSIGISFEVDVLIDFTEPSAVLETAEALRGKGIPWVVGTTGWSAREVLPIAEEGNIPLLYGPNFSIGVAIYSRLARLGAKMMAEEFSMRGVETHHSEKKDTPSGTARKLMNEIDGLIFDSVREGDHFGIHELIFESKEDQIELVHRAKNRKGFAKGAVVAAEWMIGKEGIYTFDAILEEMWNQKSLQPLLPH
ncbi:MAG: dihydrodipicolinate reductase [Chlamydiales bacterium]|nr:dihydrodipicolinate reductase [Chlamydiales bacterium]